MYNSSEVVNINININTNIDCMMKALTLTFSDGFKLAGKQWSHVNDHIENSNDTLILL